MRPDSVVFDTRDMVAVEFSPQRKVGRRLSRILGIGLGLQFLFTCLILFTAVMLWTGYRGRALASHAAEYLAHMPARSLRQPTDPELKKAVDRGELAFIAVVDERAGLQTWQIWDEQSWAKFHPTRSPSPGGTFEGAYRTLMTSLLVHRAKIDSPFGSSSSRQIVIGLRAWPVQGVVLLGVSAICLAILPMLVLYVPLMTSRIRRWAGGLDDLLAAIQHVARGGRPEPVNVGIGELGYMAVAFNTMAIRLRQAHQNLSDANNDLEERVRDRTHELRELAGQLETLASTDPLTGLANRRTLYRAMDNELRERRQTGEDVVCLLIDLDGFKQVNDRLGHSVGDCVLTLTAEVLRSTCRQRDLVGRLGGDEFVILLINSDIDHACEVADRLQQELARRLTEIEQIARLSHPPTLSIGIALMPEGRVTDSDQLLIDADRAMYQAKREGKACYHVYESEKDIHALQQD